MPPKRLSRILTVVFVVALIMGPGPGLYLVNPDPLDPDALRLLLGLPVIWLWAVFWFAVMAVVVWIANIRLWKQCDETEEGSL